MRFIIQCSLIKEWEITKINSKNLNHFSRYGREDEELMGLRFCNEVIVAGTTKIVSWFHEFFKE